MANRATITYNGKTISTEDRDGTFSVSYNGSTLANIAAGQTKTLNCVGKVMATNVVVGGKTLACAGKHMATNVVVSVISLFPSNPSSYNLIGTYTSSGSFTAPSTGWFQIELQGASGTGGKNNDATDSSGDAFRMIGGGGGGGGCAISRVKMNKGDSISFSLGAANTKTTSGNGSAGSSNAWQKAGDSSATINSSFNEYDHTLNVTGAYNGRDAINSITGYGTGGNGGAGSGGNHANYTGGTGANGWKQQYNKKCSGASGGNAGYSGGNAGGAGEGWDGSYKDTSHANGANAFIKIYAGNTNTA